MGAPLCLPSFLLGPQRRQFSPCPLAHTPPPLVFPSLERIIHFLVGLTALFRPGAHVKCGYPCFPHESQLRWRGGMAPPHTPRFSGGHVQWVPSLGASLLVFSPQVSCAVLTPNFLKARVCF